ncbi:DNA replication complex GINS protein PSF3-like isoform X2 [Apium graveolens]|uniref:DNA replication complex GINS protein PSF3-like isoform X2 n=1 Tax=Apium graveolens TaxID=4045 RepID=UPI003D7AB273
MTKYFDIDDILAEDELVPAIFREATNGVGLFDSTDDTNKVEPGSKLELPFWLARELHLRQAVTVNVPPCFNKRVGDKTIGLVLLIAFRTRYKEVLIKAHTAFAVAPTFLSLLTEEEVKLYKAAQSSAVAFKKWRMGGPRFEKASVLGRKRKPIE